MTTTTKDKKKKPTEEYEDYLGYLKQPIDEKAILLEAAQGKHVNGNVFALLSLLARSDRYSDYRIYVSVRKEIKESAAQKLSHCGIENYTFVERRRDEYNRVLATAKYLMTDNSFPMYFVKRSGQVYLNTWHGTPLKVLGRSDIGSSTSIGNVQSNFFKADYLLFPNEYCRDIMMKDYMIERLYSHKTVVIDYPRNDALHNKVFRKEIHEKYGLEGKRLIAYMPTWRGTGRTVDVESQVAATEEQVKLIAGCLNDDEMLCVNLHFLVGNRIDISGLDNVCMFPAEYETYDFLGICDTLITDYSSVMFDYAATGGEVILYMYDYEEYLRDKGFYFDVRTLPFRKAYDAKELAEQLHSAPSEEPLESKYEGNHYGCAAQSVLDMWIDGNEEGLQIRDYSAENDTEVLYAGDLNRPLARRLMNDCLSRYDADAKKHLAVAFDCDVTMAAAEELASLDPDVHFVNLYMVKNRNYSKLYLNSMGNADDPQLQVACETYEREADRILGSLNYKKLTYLNTGAPERLIALTFAKGLKEAFDLPAFFMGEKAYQLVGNRDAYKRLLNRFDRVIPYPAEALPRITDGTPADGIKTELSSFSCSRAGTGTELKLSISTVCDMPFEASRSLRIGDIEIDCTASDEEFTTMNGSTYYTGSLRAVISDEEALKLSGKDAVSVVIETAGCSVSSPVLTTKKTNAEPFKALQIPGADRVLTLQTDSECLIAWIRNINRTDGLLQKLLMTLAWIWHRLTSGHRSTVVCAVAASGYEGSAAAVYEALRDDGHANAYYISGSDGAGADSVRPEYRKGMIRRFSFRHYYELFSADTIITEGDIEDCLESGGSSLRFRRSVLHGSRDHIRLGCGAGTPADRVAAVLNTPETSGKRRICVPSAAEARRIVETTGYKSKEIWQTGEPEFDGYGKVAEKILAKMKEDGLI